MSRKDLLMTLTGLFVVVLGIIAFVVANEYFGWGISIFLNKLNIVRYYVILAATVLGLFFLHKDSLVSFFQKEEEKEQRYLEARTDSFSQQFPEIATTWIGRKIVLPLYREGLYLLVILAAVGVFCWVKAPYMDLPFTGQYHVAKYASYVEPAKWMLDHGPFWYQKNYLKTTAGDPFAHSSMPQGTYKAFSSYPILEWTLAAAWKIFPSTSWEFLSRMVMTVIGIVLMGIFYAFLTYFVPRKQALFVLFLLATNIVFQFFTHLTVLDPINLIFLFWSLILLMKGLEKNDVSQYYLAGLIAGIGINIKYHALIFYVPIFFAIIFFYQKGISLRQKLLLLCYIFPQFVLQSVFFWVSVRYLPVNWPVFLPLTGAMVAVQVFLYRKADWLYKQLAKLVSYISTPGLSIGLIVISLAIIVAVFFVPQFAKMGKDFLTDGYLIFDWAMYWRLFGLEFRFASPFAFVLGLMGIVAVAFFRFPKKYTMLMVSFFLTALLYIVLICKVIYFHIYYHHFPVIALILLCSTLYVVWEYISSWIIKILVIGLFFSVFVIQNLIVIKDSMADYNEDTWKVGSFLKWNLKPNETFLYDKDQKEIISLYSERTSYFLNNATLKHFSKDMANGLSFGAIAAKYTIRYFVNCPAGQFDYRWFAKLGLTGAEQEPEESVALRTRRIRCMEHNEFCASLIKDSQPATQEMYQYFLSTIAPYLEDAGTVGNCGIYKIRN